MLPRRSRSAILFVAMAARLVALAGPVQGQTWTVGEELSIGRSAANRIQIEDLSLSRQHCAVRAQDGQYRVEDARSSNGTFVNGLPVTSIVLVHGDQIRAGHLLFVFLQGDPSPDEPDAAPVGAGVELDEGQITSGSTVLLRTEDAMYLAPGKAVAAIKRGERALRDLETLLRIGTAIREVRDLEALETRLLRLTGETIPAERGAILLIGDAPEEIRSSGQWRRAAGDAVPMVVSRAVVEQVLREQVAVLRNDIAKHDDLGSTESLLTSGARSLVAVPLISFQQAVGVIYLDSKSPQPCFDEQHLQLLTGIAGIAASALDNALRVRDLKSENARLNAEINVRHNMVGDSPAMRKVLEFVAKAAPTAATVLIRGESGTGKELVARAIHRNSARFGKPFVAINCAALTESLLESELFGHERGAFTGAVAQKRGKLEEAEGGSLFLDEVGELAAGMQAKLLRVLQEREFERVGGTRTIKANIRLIAATNRDLEEASRSGGFRQDLYYRLNVVLLTTPALRERREDIPLLANYFVQKHAAAVGRKVIGLSADARACLMHYDWPGNVRELENAIERAVVLGSTEKILPEDLPETVAEAERPAEPGNTRFNDAVKEAKKEIVLKAIEHAGGNYAEAAKLLNLHPSNLHRLIRTLGMRPASK
jgi:transcriptional regulator with GAF, ATPase, and Fis domain